MTYADIINALPPDVAALLHTKLDAIQFAPGMSADEAKELVDGAVQLTRLEMVIADDEKRRMIDALLTQVAPAAVAALFP